jgi:hypothetical protein
MVSSAIWGTKTLLLVIFCNKKATYLIHRSITVMQGAMRQTPPSGTSNPLVMFLPQGRVIDILNHPPTTPSRVGAQGCIPSLHPRRHFHQDRGTSHQRHLTPLLQIHRLLRHRGSLYVNSAKIPRPPHAPFIRKRRRNRASYPMGKPEPSKSLSNYQIKKWKQS